VVLKKRPFKGKKGMGKKTSLKERKRNLPQLGGNLKRNSGEKKWEKPQKG